MTSRERLVFRGIPVEVRRRGVRYSRVEFRRGGVRLVLPPGVDPGRQLEAMKDAVIRGHRRLQSILSESRGLTLCRRDEQQLMVLIRDAVVTYSGLLGVTVKEIKLRRMKRRWGSCRRDGTITINRRMGELPDDLVVYVVVHELLHLKIPGHNRRFKERMRLLFPDMDRLERRLTLFACRCLPE